MSLTKQNVDCPISLAIHKPQMERKRNIPIKGEQPTPTQHLITYDLARRSPDGAVVGSCARIGQRQIIFHYFPMKSRARDKYIKSRQRNWGAMGKRIMRPGCSFLGNRQKVNTRRFEIRKDVSRGREQEERKTC